MTEGCVGAARAAKRFLPMSIEPKAKAWRLAPLPHRQPQLRRAYNAPMSTRKPYVIDSGRLRSLHFNADEIQSAMWLARPDALYLEYTRLMMGFLLFSPKPRRIAMIGLGGGSLAKFCHRHLPTSEIVAVERDAGVIALRDAFAIPPDDARLRIVEGDGGAFVAAQPDGSIDVLLVDGYSGDGLPAELGSQDFYERCADALAVDGVLVCNLHEAQTDFVLQAARIRRSFGATLEVREGERGNCIVFAGGLAFAAALRRLAVRRPQDLDRNAWHELKASFGRVVAAARA
jgi:spermidine synthase